MAQTHGQSIQYVEPMVAQLIINDVSKPLEISVPVVTLRAIFGTVNIRGQVISHSYKFVQYDFDLPQIYGDECNVDLPPPGSELKEYKQVKRSHPWK